MTKYPIIFIDCKNAKGCTFDQVLKMYTKQLRLTFKQHEYLLKIWKMNKSNESDDDIEERTQQFKKYIGFKQLEEDVLIDGLKLLSEWLYEYFCKQKHSSEGVVILMDEYDAPINFAVNSNQVTNEDVEKIHLFFDQVYSATFKENDFLFRGLITGISGIVRASAGSEFKVHYIVNF